jgi:hypothetical protein
VGCSVELVPFGRAESIGTIKKTIKDRHSLKTPNLKSEKPFGFRS